MSLVDDFETDEIEVCRFARGEWVTGRFQAKIDKTFPMTVNVQPMEGNQLLALPEGRRERENLAVCSDERLVISDEKNLCKADIVTWRGNRYEVHISQDWTKTDLPHYSAVMSKVDGEGRSGT